jgi:hypothetical protein
VRNVGGKHPLAVGLLRGRHLARHAMNRAGADRGCIVKRPAKHGIEVVLAPGNAGHTGLSRDAERRVDAENFKLMTLDLTPHGVGGLAIGKRQFNGVETARRRRREPVEQGTFNKQVSEVGGETGHRPLFEWGGTHGVMTMEP